ncbi:antirepressor AbbA [Bacillus cereus group sp. BfR-BA-01380]|uniref:antirepressor AbbA n=1 Tax=Bacillus cereus group sp. BfR-BA-01380 TaxID=2920324 RepID=UPI001F59F5F2|nr:antirepressor AbbA [Bacillus cereus group sp. BfR-BA-01380]
MSREIDLTKEEQNLLLDVLFQQNYASEILSVELSDIENGQKKTDIAHYKQVTSLFARLKNEGY